MNNYAVLRNLFEDWLVSHEKSVSTADLYGRILSSACKKLGHPITWTKDNLTNWVNSKQVQASTHNVKVAAFRALAEFLQENEVWDKDLSEDLNYRTVPERLPKNVDEVIIEQISSKITDPQDIALFELLFGSGLRRVEAATLNIGNLLSKDVLRIIGKGNKERRTTLTDVAYKAIRNWVLRDHPLPEVDKNIKEAILDTEFWKLWETSPDTPVFVTSEGTPVQEMKDPGYWVYKTIRKYGDISPHQLRHTWATELLANGADSLSVKNAGGWSSMHIMEGYRKVLPREVTRIKSLHPRQLKG